MKRRVSKSPARRATTRSMSKSNMIDLPELPKTPPKAKRTVAPAAPQPAAAPKKSSNIFMKFLVGTLAAIGIAGIVGRSRTTETNVIPAPIPTPTSTPMPTAISTRTPTPTIKAHAPYQIYPGGDWYVHDKSRTVRLDNNPYKKLYGILPTSTPKPSKKHGGHGR